ncbi:MAG: perosamine synthetase [Betaproteobacteria bacterium]|jgi:dTDP-4-amino-4,6-dideoxygalactose transaminase|nr:perosamine synthetase [Betaproteobacteria bacterium]
MNETRKIAFGRPWITDAEKNAVMQVLSGDVLTHGPQAHAFEKEFAAVLGGGHCLTTSSGMAALHLAYWQLGIGAGDEVIVAAQTHVATAHAVEVVGAKPVFADCDLATGNMDPAQIEALITPRTRAIGLVHYAGIPCDMDAIMAIAERHKLKVIEDCALAVGTRWRGKHAGLFGDAAIVSFYPVKHITTGDGGMFVSRHAELAAKVAKARAFGVDRGFAERAIPGVYDVPTLGINYRMSDINAAIGRKQLERLNIMLDRRRSNFARLKAALSQLENVRVLDVQAKHAENSHYCLTALLEGGAGQRRDAMVAKLNAAGVGTSVYYPHPVPRLKYYRDKYGYDASRFPNAARISDHAIALPVGPHVGDEDIDYIARQFAQALRESK